MDGVILAAGAGTRLRPLTNAIPKVLVSVGPYPLAEHVLRGLASCGVDNITFVTGYMAGKVENYFNEGALWDVSTSFVKQDEMNGTAHALLCAADMVTSTPFFVAYGDIFLASQRNYQRFLEFHLNGGFDFSIMLNEVDDPYEGAAVYCDGDRVTKIIEKPPKGTSRTNLNKRGILLVDYRIFDLIEDIEPGPGGELYLTDAVAMAIDRGLRVGGCVCRGFSSDVGTPERLAEARKVYEEKMTGVLEK